MWCARLRVSGPFPPPPPPAPIIEVVVASPHLKEKELEWVLQDIEVKKTHMSSDLRKSFALYPTHTSSI